MRGCLLALVLILGACTTTGDKLDRPLASEEDGNVFTDAVSSTFYGVIDTVRTPFYDLGLISDEIPEKLITAAADPYDPPESKKCKAILDEIAALNEVLGEDKYEDEVMLARSDVDVSYLSEGIQLASGMAIAKAGKKVALPFRGVIRRISGASKHEKQSEKAYQAGEIRRAYLRGMADATSTNCFKHKRIKVDVKTKPDKDEASKAKPKKKQDKITDSVES